MELTTLATVVRMIRAHQVATEHDKKIWTYTELLARTYASLEDETLDVEYKALVRFITAMPDEEKHELVALCWFGRGDDYDYHVALRAARRQDPDNVADYIAGKAALDQVLIQGVNRLLGVPDEDAGNRRSGRLPPAASGYVF